jgi:hypothetical protein
VQQVSNTELWDRVKTTDPRAVKPITGKTYKGNSPKPYWLIQRATEEFGPVGIGWGVEVKSERFERMGEFDVLHVAVVSVWYVVDGKRSQTFDQMGGTKAAYMSAANKLIVDEDAGKKSVTDGMVKCLSMLGFAGDIFSGMWDDSKYVEQAGQHYAEKERQANPDRAVWLAAWLEAIAMSPTVGECKRLTAEAVAEAKSENDSDAEGQFLAAQATKMAKAKKATA